MAKSQKERAAAPPLEHFHPFFQPIVALRTGQLRGLELLARWNHPARGWLSPEVFVPDAERNGWIDELTWELLRKAFTALAEARTLPSSLELAINVSPLQLRNPELPARIQDIADGLAFPLDRLTIEITESAVTQDIEHARSIAHELKRRGCRLALDDFGTGYSSLSQLESLPFDELKVDRSFTACMTEKRSSRKIVAAVIGLGQSLGLTTLAEGVETPEQVEMLLWLGCECAQGWLYGEPIGAEALKSINAGSWHANVASLSLPEGVRDGTGDGGAPLKKLENLPAQRLAQLQAVYDGAPVGLAFIDCNLRYVSINKRLADMNGHPVEAHLGRTVREMIPEIYPVVEQHIRRALNGDSVIGVELTKPPSGANPGRTIMLSYEPAYDEANEIVGVSVALMDLTGERRAEQARRESEEHLRHMMELIPQIPWVIDAEGRALDVSQRWMALTGMTDDQWRGFGWFDALHPDDRKATREAIKVATRTGLPIDVRYRVRRPGAEWKWLRSRGSARFDADGKIVCWYGSLEEADAE